MIGQKTCIKPGHWLYELAGKRFQIENHGYYAPWGCSMWVWNIQEMKIHPHGRVERLNVAGSCAASLRGAIADIDAQYGVWMEALQ